MNQRITVITATFFTIVGLLVMSQDIQINYLATGFILITVGVIQWYAFLSERKANKQENTQMFDPTNDWSK
jgi:hypothetical protein